MNGKIIKNKDGLICFGDEKSTLFLILRQGFVNIVDVNTKRFRLFILYRLFSQYIKKQLNLLRIMINN